MKIKKVSKTVFLGFGGGVALVVVGIVLWFFLCRNPIVVQVGEFFIRAREADYSGKLAKLQNPEQPKGIGLNQLILGYSRVQILESHGMIVSQQAIEKEEARIRAAIPLGSYDEKVAKIFGKDVESYRKVVVLPALASKFLYQDYFLNRAPVQVEARRAAEDFFMAWKEKPDSLPDLLKKQNLPSYSLVVSRIAGLNWNGKGKLESITDTRSPTAAAAEGEFWYQNVVTGLKNGQFREKLLEYGDVWVALHYVGPVSGQKEAYRLEAVKIPRPDYGVWLRKQLTEVRVTHLDQSSH